MAAKKRKGKTDLGHDLSEEITTVLLNENESLPQTIILLSTKPHISSEKRDIIEESIKELRTFVKTMTENIFTYEKENQEKHCKILSAITSFLKTILDLEDYSHSVDFRAIINSIVFFLINHPTNTVDAKLKNHIALLSMRYMEIAEFDENEVYIGSVTLNYFLDLTLTSTEGEKNVRKVDMKHVWSMHRFLEGLDLLDVKNNDLKDKLMLTVTNVNYIKLKEGHNVIGHLMSRNVIFAKKVHKLILSNAVKLSKQLAAGYGDAYFIGWSLAKEDDVRGAIELNIQDLMIKVLKNTRGGLEMPKSGSCGLAILSTLHQSRRLKKFSDVLNKLYTPVIWRTLRSCDPWERCNGAQVFLDVFPLEMPFVSEPENANYMDRQIKEIQDILTDDSHFVRIVAIRGVCAHLTRSLELFSVTHVKTIMKILLEELASDGSSYLVRKAVFEGLEMMVNGPPNTGESTESEAATVLEPLLPLMYLSIHDENEKVRKAVVKLLLKIKEKSEVMRLRYWDVVPLKHLVVRLALEGQTVGELIVKLIISEFYVTGQNTDKTINRLMRLMSWNLAAIKKLFHYSKNVLTAEQAFYIIVTLIGIIRKKLREHLDSQSEWENENKKDENLRKKKRKGSLEDISNKTLEKEKNESETSSPSSSPPSRSPNEINAEFLENYQYIAGLINGASVLWVAFRNEIGENEKYLDNLYSLACSAIPLFLKHYKGTSVYYATVSFASLIPISKLKGVSTVSSACISELKEISDGTEVSKIQCLIYSLCSWYRGHDVLDLASEWLNYAFREQNLNNSAMPVKAGHRAAKVRFVPTEGKPMLSLKLLDILFSDVLNETRLLCKNYEQLYDFYICLERVVVIIERKVAGETFKADTQLTDEFLSKAYSRYLRLMHSLHRPELPPQVTDAVPPFSALNATLQAITWASSTLYKHLPTEDGTGPPPLAANCCLSVLKEATLIVALGLTDQTHCKAVALFASDLLSFDCVWFLEEVLHTIRVLSDYAQDETPDDEWLLLKNILPCLLEKSLNLISNLEVTTSMAKKIFKDIPSMKTSLFAFPKTLLSVYGSKNSQFDDTLKMYVNTCVQIVVQEINNEDELIRCKTLDEQPYFVSLILKCIMGLPVISKRLFPNLLYYINFYHEEGYKLLSSLSILFTVAYMSKAKSVELAVEVVIQEAYQVLKNYKEKEKTKSGDLDESGFTNSSVNIDVMKVGESLFEELSKHLNCALVKPLPEWSTVEAGPSTLIKAVTAESDKTPGHRPNDSTTSSSTPTSSSTRVQSKSSATPSTSDDGVFLVPAVPPISPKYRTTPSSHHPAPKLTPASKYSATPTSRQASKRGSTSRSKHLLTPGSTQGSTPGSQSATPTAKQTPITKQRSTPTSKQSSKPTSKNSSTPSAELSSTPLSDSNSNPECESVFTPSPECVFIPPSNPISSPPSTSEAKSKPKKRKAKKRSAVPS